ncbi:MAG: trimethylamine methyltransferase family protein [Thermodesulfobacteriota bacterium]
MLWQEQSKQGDYGMSRQYKCRNPLNLLSDTEILNIHNKSLQVLEEVGIRFEDKKALKIMADNGCEVNHDTSLVKIPSWLVEKSISQCPADISLMGRDGQNEVLFNRDIVQFGPCSGMQIMDVASEKLRPGKVEDAIRTACLTDALEIMSGVNTGLGFISDRPSEINLVWNYAVCCRNSGKIFCLGAMEDSVKWGVRMAEVTGQDVIIPLSSSSPLMWSAEQIDALYIAASNHRPVTLQSMASPGSTAPVTLSGAAIVMNSEVLAMLTLSQLLQPGLGVIYSCFTLPMDMRLGTLSSGSMELSLLNVASAQLSRHYGLGSMIWGPNTDAKTYDQQAGYEKMMQWLMAAMSGINLIWGAGMIENHTIWSDAQVIVDAEMCNIAGRYLQGTAFGNLDDDLTVIRDTGHFPNNFLAHDHTLVHLRSEHYIPWISSRENYEVWIQMKNKNLMDRGLEYVNTLLQKHDPTILSPHENREIETILSMAAKEKGLDSPLG